MFRSKPYKMTRWSAAVLIAALTALTFAQTKIVPPPNKYKPSDDIQIGRKGAQEVRQQMPIFPQGDDTDRYVERVGQRLVQAIPQEYEARFEYSFDVVNARDINAFALPGGPMFVNRGMIEAAKTEGEMAGVMAHEISHVVLRHGTAQATKAGSAKVQAPAILGQIAGAIIGGNLGGIIAQGSQIGAAAYILKYSREYESQADILGAQIMARAGYDPRDLANMFKTIEAQSGGSSGPEWLSSHPNPGNRYERINQEAALLRVNRTNTRYDVAEFERVKTKLRSLPQAPTMAEIDKQKGGGQPTGGGTTQTNEQILSKVEVPSSRYRDYAGGNVFRLQVPENWRDFAAQSSVTFAPRGGIGNVQGQTVYTHGAEVGVTQANGRDLREASDNYLNSLLQGNSYLRATSGYRRVKIDNRTALGRALSGRSPTTGKNETVTIYTAQQGNGGLFFIILVAPDDEYRTYQPAFETILRTIRISQ